MATPLAQPALLMNATLSQPSAQELALPRDGTQVVFGGMATDGGVRQARASGWGGLDTVGHFFRVPCP